MMRKTRQEIARKEATRDPIFLFQWAELIITEPQMLVYCNGCERVYKTFNDHDCDSDDGILTDKELLEHGWAKLVWHTDGVYLTRDEGENDGRLKSHHYRNGWRVFCVCAEGELAKLLLEYG
jgi:hypothetical protein